MKEKGERITPFTCKHPFQNYSNNSALRDFNIGFLEIFAQEKKWLPGEFCRGVTQAIPKIQFRRMPSPAKPLKLQGPGKDKKGIDTSILHGKIEV